MVLQGLTLQELLAPKEIDFFSRNWSKIGTRAKLKAAISSVTHIHETALSGSIKKIDSHSIAQKFSWASRRTTTREEDVTYSLLGLFHVNMPLLHGERRNAFIRLQQEILKVSDDESIFAWQHCGSRPTNLSELLATRPTSFERCASVLCFRNWESSEP